MTELPVQSLLADLLASAERIVAIHASGSSLDGPVHKNDDLAIVLYHFVVIGETAIRLGDAFHDRHPSVPWRRIIDHRNLIAHGYDTVEGALLGATIEHQLPDLIREIGSILDSYGPPPTEE